MTESFKFPGGSKESLPDEATILFKAAEIREYINSLKGAVSNNSLAVAQAAVWGYSEQELASKIWNSNEDDWQQKPAFYSELCDRYYSVMKSKNENGN